MARSHRLHSFTLILGLAALGSSTATSEQVPRSLQILEAMQAAQVERKVDETNYMIKHRTRNKVCYNHRIGCFTNKDADNWGYLPKDPGELGFYTRFNLFTRNMENQDLPKRIRFEVPATYSDVDAFNQIDRPLYVIVHGFSGDASTSWVIDMKDALLKAQDANVLTVDWKLGAAPPVYNQAAANTMSVGRAIGFLLSEIVHKYDYPAANIHFIGFSLGAHVGGFAGRHFYNLTNSKFGRMSLLDPAAPSFENTDVHVRKTDSDFTMAIHTSSGGSILDGKLGMTKPVGHLDFYANGGSDQPGCSVLRVADLTCNHYRAHMYFTEAIRNWGSVEACQFTARHCQEGWEKFHMGRCTIANEEIGLFSLHSRGSGQMFMKTKSNSPFCTLDHGIKGAGR